MRRTVVEGIYLVADYDLVPDAQRLLKIVEESAGGGASLVQLRAKHLDTRPMVDLAKALVEVLKPFGVPLILNDRADVALAAGAAGLHVGQKDLRVEDARRILGHGAIIGLSVETMAEVEEANGLQVDYIAASPVFNTPTKTDTAPAWGLDGLTEVARISKHPVVAIGGINLSNAKQLANAGAASLAIVTAIMLAEDAREATAALHASMKNE
jgi:thiamine-phosphate pyrophosphorylase